MNNYFIAGLIFLNLLLILYYNKKTIKNLFLKKKIKSVDLVEVNKIFLPSKNFKFKFPKEDVVIKIFLLTLHLQ